MNDPNPYAASKTYLPQTGDRDVPSTKRLWIAYMIAPMVAPVVAAMTVLIIAFVYQSTHPADVETNPMSMILAPLLLLVAGIPASYVVAGLLGMPIAFLLLKHDQLNFLTVHGAALLWAIVMALAVMIIALIGNGAGTIELVTGSLFLGLLLAPFILLSATVFWLIGVRP